ncbi:MAG: hypothetical protein RLZZ133_1668 [Pseudomonadota bacterium]
MSYKYWVVGSGNAKVEGSIPFTGTTSRLLLA